jgi:Ca-activated chloride channel family protein
MSVKLIWLVGFIALLSFIFPTSVLADGIIIPEPPICDPAPCPPVPFPMEQLVIRYHHVQVKIKDQVAVTHVDQVFYNPNTWTIEGTYLFPVPADASVNAFTLWVDGKPVQAELLEAEQARQAYEDIVRSLRDPALLEYAGRGALRARIFPIPPQGERRIELEYTQALAAENGLVRYIYPLNTEKFSAQPLQEVVISVDVQASAPIRAVYSPSHTVAISRASDTRVSAGYEARNVLPNTDFALYFSSGEGEAFHLLTYRAPGDATDPDGFFLLLLAARLDQPANAIPKDVLLVLDRSGSMEGDKFRQAQAALGYILRHLNPKDRFNIIAFSTGLETFASSLQPAHTAAGALAWVDGLSAQGSTDINRALLEAAGMVVEGVAVERPTYLIFLTDGLPTEGVVQVPQILVNFAQAAPPSLRLFAFGVGYDVDTYLLDSLAQAHHGSTTYVLPDERLDEILSGFYARISTPVLTNPSVDFGEIRTFDLYPNPLPDLFRGSQVIVVGRYRDGGTTTVTLNGLVNGADQSFRFPGQVFASASEADSSAATLPRLWATRKIGYLLNQIRLNGADQETIDQIVKLSIRFGIVTPYTSYLVTDPLPLGAQEQERIAVDQFNQLQSQPQVPASGQAAVEKAVVESELAQAEAPASPDLQASQLVRIVGARTFVNHAGTWIDTTYDPQSMPTQKVVFLSGDYFALAQAHPELAAAFALGGQVIVVQAGTAYEVVAEGTPVEPLAPLSTPDSPLPNATAAIEPTTSPAATSTPGLPAQPATPPPAPGQMPCAGGLAILIFLPLVWLQRRR